MAFLYYVHDSHNYNADPSDVPSMGYKKRCKLHFQGSGAQTQQHTSSLANLSLGTASGTKGFFLYSNSKV